MIGSPSVDEALALSVPTKRVSAWVAETDPKATQAWLELLPMADSAEAARELYQALYTLNRLDLEVAKRAELLELYAPPLATVVAGLENHLAQFALPLSPRRRQLAEFIRQLFIEMAAGYKCCLKDLQLRKVLWGKKHLHTIATARALHYLSQVLVRSYLVYMPYPPLVWREIHELYRYAETNHCHEEPVAAIPGAGEQEPVSIAQYYLRALLLGLSNPYQLTRTECLQVARFLDKWAGKARMLQDVDVRNPAGQFLVDLTADAPPTPWPRTAVVDPHAGLRVLDALGLVRTVHGFVNELQAGKPAASLALGFECLDSVCLDILQRMMRAWGLVARRRHSRMRRRGFVSMCVGINAVHFFSNGQVPFAPNRDAQQGATGKRGVRVFHRRDESTQPDAEPAAGREASAAEAAPAPADLYRIDRWQVRDISPQGMLLARNGDALAHVRVGEVLGVQRADEPDHWNVAAVRWIRSPKADEMELGIELLSPRVSPIAVRPIGTGVSADAQFMQGLLLPAVEALHRPATLLLPRGMYRPGLDYEIVTGTLPARTVRAIELVERANTYERVVIADIAH